MNERIKQLLNEATSRHVQETDRSKVMTVSDGEMITFAELIVRECAELVEYNSKGAGQDIKEHFGVE